MDPKRITMVIVSAIIGVILLVTVVSPIVADGQTTSGTAAEVTNPKPAGANYDYKIWDGSDITFGFTSTDAGGTYTINGEPFALLSSEQRIILASNDFAARSGGNETVFVLNSQYIGSDTQFSNADFTYTITNKQYTLELGGSTYTGSVDWLVYATTDGNAGLIQCRNINEPFYTSTTNNIIVLGNIYTTGDNDTFYSYYNGDLSVNEAYADESSIAINKTLVDGYTDIYNTTVAVNIGDETFTPYFILIPETVTGHAASGAVYSMLGVIPIVIAIGIVMAIVGMAIVNRYE